MVMLGTAKSVMQNGGGSETLNKQNSYNYIAEINAI